MLKVCLGKTIRLAQQKKYSSRDYRNKRVQNFKSQQTRETNKQSKNYETNEQCFIAILVVY